MTIREELEKLGPKRVRRGMVAFEHRARGEGYDHGGCGIDNVCCFLSHAGISGLFANVWFCVRARSLPSRVEAAFERWAGAKITREELRAECIAFLAEHGDAKEIAPVREVVSGSAVVDSEALQK